MSNFQSNNKNFEFYNILRNSGSFFTNKEEVINLHTKNMLLNSCIKLRKDIEYEYNKLKINQLKSSINELEFQEKIFENRNQDILSNIQSNSLKGFDLSSRTNQSLGDLYDERKKYQNYLNGLLDTIRDDFIYQLNLKCGNDLEPIENNQNKLRQNNNMFKFNNEYYSKLKSSIEKKENDFNKINEYYSENPYILKNKEKNDDDTGVLNINISKNNPNLNQLFINEEDSGISGNNKKQVRYIEKRYVLNRNHNPGKLDDIRQKQIDKLNEQLKKEYIRPINEINSSITSGSKSFENINISENIIGNDEINFIKDNNNINNSNIIMKNESDKKEIISKEISNKTEINNITTTVIEKKTDIKINISENNDTSNVNNNIPVNTLDFKRFEVPEETKLTVQIEDNPDLNSRNLSNDDKILVLNKLINKIDDQSKTLRDGKIYEKNIINSINKFELKKKFYDLLKSIKNNNLNEIELSNDYSIQLIYELLNSSPEICITDTQKLLNKNDYNEIDLKKDINPSFLKIFEIILEHIKKMVDLKRIDVSLACEIFINSLLKDKLNDNNLKMKLNMLLEKIFMIKSNEINLLDNDDEYNDFEQSDNFNKKESVDIHKIPIKESTISNRSDYAL